MKVLILSLGASLGFALSVGASAQVPSPRLDASSQQKGSGPPLVKGASSPRSALGTSQLGGGMIFVSTDSCGSPTVISGAGSHPFDTTTATTSGFSGGGACGGGSATLVQDVFWQWTANASGDYQFDTFGSTFDTQLSVHSGLGCAALCVGFNDDFGGSLQSRVTVSGVSAGATFVIQVGGWGAASGTGVLNVHLMVPPTNDACTTATPIAGLGSHSLKTTLATTSGFAGGGGCASGSTTINQDVFWQWTASAPGDYEFDTFGSGFDTKLSIHAGVGCAAVCVGYNDDSGGPQSMVRLSGVNAGDTFLVQVGGFGTQSGTGWLNIGTWVDPCNLPPDMFEPNNSCAAAVPIGDGTYTGLAVSRTDRDFYQVEVAAGDTLSVTLLYTVANGDIDLFVYLAGNCTDVDGACTGTLGCGYTSSDDEFASWTNNTGVSQTCIIKVNIWPSSTQADCNVYDMIVSGTTGGGAPIEFCEGAATCPCANPSDGSLGVAGCQNSAFPSGCRITVGGTFPGATTIVAQNAKPGEFALVLRGSSSFAGVPVFDGVLCIGGSTARTGAIFIDGAGAAQSPVLPQGPPGVQWNYQFWYRDTGLCAGSNLSNAVGIIW